MTLDNLVKVTIFLSDRKYIADYRRVRHEVLQGRADRADHDHHRHLRRKMAAGDRGYRRCLTSRLNTLNSDFRNNGPNFMKSHVKAVVIGGGVVGCSVLYHLAKAGWTDIMLIERSELTSGSSWHAAGGFHTLNGDPNVAKLQAYTVQLYKELEELSGQSCSLHLTGGVMMADTPERMDFLRLAHAKGRYLGMDTELITPSEAKAMFPLMDETNFVGAMWDPVEGHLDPSGTTHRLCQGRAESSAPRSCCATASWS